MREAAFSNAASFLSPRFTEPATTPKHILRRPYHLSAWASGPCDGAKTAKSFPLPELAGGVQAPAVGDMIGRRLSTRIIHASRGRQIR